MSKYIKRIFAISVIVAIIATVVCTLPFPRKIDLTLQAAAFKQDGTYVRDAEIHLSGNLMDYLFREDTIELSFESSAESEIMEGDSIVMLRYQMDGDKVCTIPTTIIPFYSPICNTMERFTFTYNQDLTQFRIETNRYIYIASTTGDDPAQLYIEFSKFFQSAN